MSHGNLSFLGIRDLSSGTLRNLIKNEKLKKTDITSVQTPSESTKSSQPMNNKKVLINFFFSFCFYIFFSQQSENYFKKGISVLSWLCVCFVARFTAGWGELTNFSHSIRLIRGLQLHLKCPTTNLRFLLLPQGFRGDVWRGWSSGARRSPPKSGEIIVGFVCAELRPQIPPHRVHHR